MSKAGEFEIEVSTGGHPIWVTIHHRGVRVAKAIHALELRDLGHAVKQARREARQVARGIDPKRVDDY